MAREPLSQISILSPLTHTAPQWEEGDPVSPLGGALSPTGPLVLGAHRPACGRRCVQVNDVIHC